MIKVSCRDLPLIYTATVGGAASVTRGDPFTARFWLHVAYLLRGTLSTIATFCVTNNTDVEFHCAT